MAAPFRLLLRKFRNLSDRVAFNMGAFRPRLSGDIDEDLLITQAVSYFSIPLREANEQYLFYRAFSTQIDYAQKLGESRTLSFEEAFLIYLSIRQLRPPQVVEIGTQFGKSTRRIVDILNLLSLDSQVTCFDILDEMKYVSHDEVKLAIRDVTNDFQSSVLKKIYPGVIFLDARPYHLLKNVITSYLEWSLTYPCVMAIHDCSPGLYNPRMWISRNRQDGISSRTGVWERHVLAEIFGVVNDKLEEICTSSHHLRIFNTQHGLALISPNNIFRGTPNHR
jgi:hypothetical protein